MAACQGPPRTATPTTLDVRTQVPIQETAGGSFQTWDVLMESLSGASVVILGELHNDAVGHGVQLAAVEDILAQAGDGAVAMEMLERDEQLLVEDYIDGVLSSAEFAKMTNSAAWAGPGSWSAWYQPIIDATVAAGGHVIAANAPRRYVTLARTGGVDAVDRLSPERRVLVELPQTIPPPSYLRRFKEAMGDNRPDDSVIDDYFRAQQTWDTTMAHSIAAAGPRPDRPVILLVGQFHSNYQGGVTASLKELLGDGVEVVVIAMVPTTPGNFEAGDPVIVGDAPIADIIIYTEDAR
jgi:uncharacterized iron-regulated protein